MAFQILIIEDEAGIRSFLEMGLTEEGYEVMLAEFGQKGLDLFYSEKPDLLLLDWMLPDMEGIEILSQIRSTHPQVPIIMLTAKDRVQDTVEGLRSGANDYLKKPFSFDELLERIKVQLRNVPQEERYVCGNFILNADKRTAHIGEEEIKLTLLEFDLLLFLLKDQASVHRREDILRAVWKSEAEYKSGVLDVFMNSIRKKIDASIEPSTMRIETVRGVGYKMVAL